MRSIENEYSTEPKAQDELLWPLAVRPFVRKHLWTSSPLKPLGQFSSNFMRNLLLKGGLKICTNGHGPYIKMGAMSIYGKTFEKFLLQNQEYFKAETGTVAQW